MSNAAAKFALSAAFVAASAAYGYWQNVVHPPTDARKALKLALAAATPVPVAPAPAAPVSADAPSSAPTLEAAPEQDAAQNANVAEAPAPEAATVAIVAPAATPTAVSEIANKPRKRFTFSDGDFTGKEADSEWGPVQVKVAIRDGYITDVQFLQIPGHRDRSAEISAWAAPRLITETIQDQYYDIDIVTSATFTTVAYQRTLWSALSQAQK